MVCFKASLVVAFVMVFGLDAVYGDQFNRPYNNDVNKNTFEPPREGAGSAYAKQKGHFHDNANDIYIPIQGAARTHDINSLGGSNNVVSLPNLLGNDRPNVPNYYYDDDSDLSPPPSDSDIGKKPKKPKRHQHKHDHHHHHHHHHDTTPKPASEAPATEAPASEAPATSVL